MSYEILFDLQKEAPALYEEVCQKSPRLGETIEQFRSEPKFPSSSKIGREGRYFRLPGYFRTFCYELADHAPTSDLSSDVLVVRGADAILDDYGQYVRWLGERAVTKIPGHMDMPGHRNMADDISLVRRRAPGALLRSEAATEATTGVDVHRRHLELYGELAHLPVPLLTFALPEERAERAARLLRENLSDIAWNYISGYVHHGLAISLSYYPTAPLRLDQVLTFRSDGPDAFPEFARDALRNADLFSASGAWMRMFVRLLYVGYLPTSTFLNALTNVLQSSSVCLDGGFRTVSSLYPLDQAPNDGFVTVSVTRCVDELRQVIAAVFEMSGSQEAVAGLLGAILWGRLSLLVEEERAAGGQLDPRVARVFGLSEVRNLMTIAPHFRATPDMTDYEMFVSQTSE